MQSLLTCFIERQQDPAILLWNVGYLSLHFKYSAANVACCLSLAKAIYLQVADFKEQLLTCVGVGAGRIEEFSCGESWRSLCSIPA